MTTRHPPSQRSDPARRGPDTSATDIATLPDAVRTFLRHGSPQLLVGGVVLAVAARVAAGVAGVGRWSVWDLAAVAAVVALVPLVEWFVHRVVLHTAPRQLGPMWFDPGAGHRAHHQNPSSVPFVLLRGVDAAVFQVVNAALAVCVVWSLLAVLGVDDRGGPILTGVVTALVALTHYEWAHFLFHTAYRPRTARYRRLKANHRLHHWRNEGYWLGITSNAGDRLARTLPAAKGDVPASATARTLGIDPDAS
ncbi:MAG: sterol desaturase family protein [Actinomycetota bacterium]